MSSLGCNVVLRVLALALGWMLLAGQSAQALEIVSAKGAAILGRPLDIRVSIRLDAADEDPCIDAQLFFAETRRAAVSQWSPAQGAATGVLRVTTNQVIDEPIVTLYVNVGCNQRLSRKFIFFAEMDTQAGSAASVGQVLGAVSAPPKSAPTVSNVPSVVVAANPGASVDAGQSKSRKQASAKAASSQATQAPADAAPRGGLQASASLGAADQTSSSGKKARKSKAEGTGKSRLKLEPLELQTPPGLRSSFELALPAQEADGKTRATASALWKAINSSPEDLLRENERMRVLEGQLGQMQSRLLAQQEALSKVQGDMERQQTHVYVLVGLLLAALAGGVFFFSRKRLADGDQPWWKERRAAWLGESGSQSKKNKFADDDADEEKTPPSAQSGNVPPEAFFNQEPALLNLNKNKVKAEKTEPEETPTKEEQASPPQAVASASSKRNKQPEPDFAQELKRTAKPASSEPVLKVDVLKEGRAEPVSSFPPDLDSVPPILEVARKPKSEQAVNSAFESFFGVELTGKNYDVQELFDVQEQSEFFITVGQHDQAIEILLNHIDANPEGSPLAYLDLFALYHKLGKRPDYDKLSSRFTVHFNAQIPSFEEYGSEKSRSLESYTAAMTRIQLLWPSEKTLNVIAESIFRKPETPESAFSLEAYQDLLLLYGILKEIHETENPAPDFVASGFQDSGFGSGFQSTRMEALPTIDIAPASAHSDNSKQGAGVDAAPSESLLEFDVYTPPKSSRLGLDIDLAEPDSIGEEKEPPAPRSKSKRPRST